MRSLKTIVAGLVAAGLFATALTPAEAGCTRRIVNKSRAVALVSRDGGPWVAIPPHRSQTIHYSQPGRIDVALTCGRGAGPEGAFSRESFGYSAIIDRCYFELGDGFFDEQIGPDFFGTRYTGPLAVNVPRQGDLTVGPRVGDACPAFLHDRVRARY